MLKRIPLLARGLVLIFAVALAATGWGHRFASAAELERAQFAQLWGAAFCVTDENGDPVSTELCAVCHVVAAIAVPQIQTGAVRPVLTLETLVFPDETHLVTVSAGWISPPPRGPPLA